MSIGLKRPYAKQVFTSFKQFMNEAVEREWIGVNPVLAVKIKMSKREKSVPEVPPPDGMKAGRSLAFDSMTSLDPMVATGYERRDLLLMLEAVTGLRASELRGLPIGAIGLREQQVKVEERADAWNVIGP